MSAPPADLHFSWPVRSMQPEVGMVLDFVPVNILLGQGAHFPTNFGTHHLVLRAVGINSTQFGAPTVLLKRRASSLGPTSVVSTAYYPHPETVAAQGFRSGQGFGLALVTTTGAPTNYIVWAESARFPAHFGLPKTPTIPRAATSLYGGTHFGTAQTTIKAHAVSLQQVPNFGLPTTTSRFAATSLQAQHSFGTHKAICTVHAQGYLRTHRFGTGFVGGQRCPTVHLGPSIRSMRRAYSLVNTTHFGVPHV